MAEIYPYDVFNTEGKSPLIPSWHYEAYELPNGSVKVLSDSSSRPEINFSSRTGADKYLSSLKSDSLRDVSQLNPLEYGRTLYQSISFDDAKVESKTPTSRVQRDKPEYTDDKPKQLESEKKRSDRPDNKAPETEGKRANDFSTNPEKIPEERGGSNKPQTEESSLLNEVIFGGFYGGDSSLAGAGLSVGIGLTPIIGQIADARDTLAAIRDVWENPKSAGAWGGLAMAGVGWIPGIGDAIKGAKKGKVALDASKELIKKGSKEVKEQLIKHEKGFDQASRTKLDKPSSESSKVSNESLSIIKEGNKKTYIGTSVENMRRNSLKLIGEDSKHPLRFLLDENALSKGEYKFKTVDSRSHSNLIDHPEIVEMGHVISKKSGEPEKVMLQAAWLNQFNANTIEKPKTLNFVENSFVDIGGIAVDVKTAEWWRSLGWIN
ncbi:MAG: hypothetical protein EOO43_03315 [Flavobacterium sp.]|nr:MAG: hypothetical protein EOO43_03315 [Flavobacterium sp.]